MVIRRKLDAIAVSRGLVNWKWLPLKSFWAEVLSTRKGDFPFQPSTVCVLSMYSALSVGRLPQRCHKVHHDFHRKIMCVGWTPRGRATTTGCSCWISAEAWNGREPTTMLVARGSTPAWRQRVFRGEWDPGGKTPLSIMRSYFCGRTGIGYFHTCRTACVGTDVVLLLNIWNYQPAVRESNKCIRK